MVTHSKQRYVFDLPPAHAGASCKAREVELKLVPRALYRSILLGCVAVSTDATGLEPYAKTVDECHKAALVRVGGDRVSAERPGEVLYYKLSTRELVGYRYCYDRLHAPTTAEIDSMLASASYADKVYTFEAPPATGDDKPRKLVIREVEVAEAERVGKDLLKNLGGDLAGLPLREKEELTACAFVSLEGAGGLASMSQRDYAVVERAYIFAHRPSDAEIDLASGSMRPA